MKQDKEQTWNVILMELKERSSDEPINIIIEFDREEVEEHEY